MSMERVRQYLDGVRIKGTALLAVGAIGLAGCTSESGQEAAAAHEDSDITYVMDDAASIEEYDTINAQNLADDIEAQPDADERYKRVENYNPKTGDVIVRDFPVENSTPLLTITYDKKSKRLVYEDSTPGLSDEESKLLGTVAANAPLIKATMASGRVGSFRFRLFEPSPSGSTYMPGETMAYMPQDYSAGLDKPKQSNIYYFVPPKGSIDLQNMENMNRHEAIHAASDHTTELNITTEQETRYKQACSTLRHNAIQTMQTMGSTSRNALYQLGLKAPEALHPAFQTVIEAIGNGTYDELPWFTEDNHAQIPECFVQTPWNAVHKQVELLGLTGIMSDFLQQQQDNVEVSDLIATTIDDWNDSIEDLTVYKTFKEARWLHTTPESKEKGHPQDGWHEIAASELNRFYGDTENLARDIRNMEPAVREATLEILAVGQEIIEEKCDKDADVIKELNAKRIAFLAAITS